MAHGELRVDGPRLRSSLEAMAEIGAKIAGRHGCGIRIEETWRVQHNKFATALVARVRETAARLGYRVLRRARATA